tara:strand:- start:55 stop:447 length:393 start_codon:yes stop_codon:yes gene_type:complete
MATKKEDIKDNILSILFNVLTLGLIYYLLLFFKNFFTDKKLNFSFDSIDITSIILILFIIGIYIYTIYYFNKTSKTIDKDGFIINKWDGVWFQFQFILFILFIPITISDLFNSWIGWLSIPIWGLYTFRK